ncbi:MAG: stress protein [Epulopiscium sp. Nele67-Bin005]|nr:MAG: stress protein [Epulopiscium sp. Nele67-Bin005]
MAVSLTKGQKVSLSKGGSGLTRILIGLGWDEVQKAKFNPFSKTKQIDCDASAIMLTDGKFTSNKDIVYFGNLRHSSNSIMHMGDNLTGEGAGDDEQVMVDLPNIPEEFDKVVIVVNIYEATKRNQHFGQIQNAFIRIEDSLTGEEMYRYNLTDDYSDMTAMIFGEVYRHNDEWKFNAIGEGTTDTNLNEIVKRYL